MHRTKQTTQPAKRITSCLATRQKGFSFPRLPKSGRLSARGIPPTTCACSKPSTTTQLHSARSAHLQNCETRQRQRKPSDSVSQRKNVYVVRRNGRKEKNPT